MPDKGQDSKKSFGEYFIKYLWYALVVGIVVTYHGEVSNLLFHSQQVTVKFGDAEVELDEAAKSSDSSEGATRGIDFQVTPAQRKALLRRATSLDSLADSARILWINDTPSKSVAIKHVLEAFHMTVDIATSSAEAQTMLNAATGKYKYSVVVSNNCRGNPKDMPGVLFAQNNFGEGGRYSGIPVIIFSGTFARRTSKLPKGVFAVTYHLHDLLNFIFDAIERGGAPIDNVEHVEYTPAAMDTLCR